MAPDATLTGDWIYSVDIFSIDPNGPLPSIFAVSLTLQESGTQVTGSGNGSLAPTPGGGIIIEDIQGTVTGSAVSLNAQIRSDPYGLEGKGTSPATFAGTWDGANSLKGTWSGAISGSTSMTR